jgi:hypothetical protein
MTILEQEIVELKARIHRLETIVQQLTGEARQTGLTGPSEPLDSEQLLTTLKAEGLVRDPTPEEQRLAAEWEGLPEVEKQAHIRHIHSLVLDPPLSQIITENRR